MTWNTDPTRERLIAAIQPARERVAVSLRTVRPWTVADGVPNRCAAPKAQCGNEAAVIITFPTSTGKLGSTAASPRCRVHGREWAERYDLELPDVLVLKR